ncbi:MAG: hypothetical protein ACLP41_04595 [Acidimicrobiales bacterium]
MEPSEGLAIVVYDHDLDVDGNRDDILADAIVARDSDNGRWIAIIDRNTLRHASDKP